MAMSINQVRSERRKDLLRIKRKVKEIDTIVEVMQRLIQRPLDRKTKIPEWNDLVKIDEQRMVLRTLIAEYVKLLTNIANARHWSGSQ